MASPNFPTCGHPKFPRQDRLDYDDSVPMAMRAAASLSRYQRAHDGVSVAKADIAQFIDWYNTARPHSSLSDETPNQTYWALLPAMDVVA